MSFSSQVKDIQEYLKEQIPNLLKSERLEKYREKMARTCYCSELDLIEECHQCRDFSVGQIYKHHVIKLTVPSERILNWLAQNKVDVFGDGKTVEFILYFDHNGQLMMGKHHITGVEYANLHPVASSTKFGVRTDGNDEQLTLIFGMLESTTYCNVPISDVMLELYELEDEYHDFPAYCNAEYTPDTAHFVYPRPNPKESAANLPNQSKK